MCLSNTPGVSGCTMSRMDDQHVIAQGARLLVTEPFGLGILRAWVRDRWPWVPESWLDRALMLLMFVGLAVGAVQHSRESRESEERNGEIEALRDYSYVARYDAFGTTGLVEPPLKET